jgi:outer membrane protein assembly factor BamA
MVPKNKKITNKYTLNIENKPEEIKLSELRALIKPKANSKLLFMRPKLYFYYKNLNKKSGINKWLYEHYGEEPVYTEIRDLNKTSRDLRIYLGNIGFFNSKIDYEIKSKNFKNDIVFNIKPSIPYRFSEITYEINDSLIDGFVETNKGESLLKPGSVYNAYIMDDERDRITKILRNSGYYLFSRNYVQFYVDSSFSNHKMNVVVKVNNIKTSTDQPGEFNENKHRRFFIKDVSIIPDFQPTANQSFDTTKQQIEFWDEKKTFTYNFLYADKVRLKPSAFNQAIKIKPGKPYSATDVQNTYRRLFSYQIIRTANINFDTTNINKSNSDSSFLDCKISLQKSNLNMFTVEAEGTNSSGDLGVRGNVIFLNKNIFQRAEVLRIMVNGGFEAQTISESNGNKGIFNTFEAGIQGSVYFPRFFSPLRLNSFNQKHNPTSNLTFGFNYQLRPNYSRNITLLSLGYSWKQNKQIKHILTPANINFVKVNPTPEFEKELEQETNKRLKEQYSDHMILGLNYSFILNNQEKTGLKNFEYFRANIETSGNLLYAFNTLMDSKKAAAGNYEFFGVRYSQYIRIDFDFRQYFMIHNKKSSVATRIYIGSGLPYLNSDEIPYERGFYAGGANGMRGWVFRTLGPGSFNGTDAYEKIGDIQLEYNIEYRFPIYSFLHGGFFADFGNIWTYNQSETFPNGQFKFNRFYKEIAADAGFGFRFDFQFFIFRIDFAAPLVNPAFPEGQRWRFDYLQFGDVIGNFGIGYPF